VRQGVRVPALIVAAFLGAFVFHALLGHPNPYPNTKPKPNPDPNPKPNRFP